MNFDVLTENNFDFIKTPVISAAGMKAGDKFKVGDQEYTLKDAIEMAGLQLEKFFSEEGDEAEAQPSIETQEEAEEINTELDRIKTLANLS